MKRAITMIMTSLAATVCGLALAEGHPPVALHIDAPNSNGGTVLLSESGWPLTIKMVVNLPSEADLPAYAIEPDFASRGETGYLVLSDPDGCLAAPFFDLPPDFSCIQDPHVNDETWIEFTPDVDLAGVPDSHGNAARREALVDSAGGGGPEFQMPLTPAECVPETGDSNCLRMGPDTGAETEDGFGFGADDDLPGLVILSDVGVGLAFDEPNFDLTDPAGAVNLAGFLNSVSYDLSDLYKSNSKEAGQKGKPTETIVEQSRFWAHMNLVPDLVRHLVQYDACVGDPGTCDGHDLWRVDGGPVEQAPENYGWGARAEIDLMNASSYTLSAFLVSGVAPDVLWDMDGDGDVDSADAALAGYTVLSNEDRVTLLLLSDSLCYGGGGGSFSADLDGNGEATQPIECPGGPGDLGRPPR